MKRIILILGVLVVLFTSVAFALTFSDVSGHWAEPYIMELTNKGVINGYEDGTYKPEGEIKKAEFLKLIMVASLPNEDWTLENVKYNPWASIYMEAAERYEIIEEGYVDEVSANEQISRADMVEILGKCDIILRGNAQESTELELYDVANMDDMKLAMLSHCVSKGLIAGYEDYTFRPNKTLTRAEVATILSRYLNK